MRPPRYYFDTDICVCNLKQSRSCGSSNSLYKFELFPKPIIVNRSFNETQPIILHVWSFVIFFSAQFFQSCFFLLWFIWWHRSHSPTRHNHLFCIGQHIPSNSGTSMRLADFVQLCIYATSAFMQPIPICHVVISSPILWISVHWPKHFELCIIYVPEYEDLLSVGNTWSMTKSPIILNHNTNSTNHSRIDLVQWITPGRGICCPVSVNGRLSLFNFGDLCTPL